MSDPIAKWCQANRLDDITEGLKEFVDDLEDLTEAEDSDIVEMIAGLKMAMKQKLRFKKAIRQLKQSNERKEDVSPVAVAAVSPKPEAEAEPEPEPGMRWTRETDEKESKELEGFVMKPDMPIKKGVYQIPTIKKKDIGPNWKTIMVIGESGSGKSTTLNSMVNYLWNVSADDDYRFVLIPPPKQAEQGQSVTSEVTSYHFLPPNLDYGLTVVDTPGFGDTSGVKADMKIVDRIEKAFKNELDTIDAVFFVLRSSQARLSTMQTYVFNSMLRVFGNDIASNLFLLITFCDGAVPPVYASVKAYKLPYQKAFELNNSAFFTGFEDILEEGKVSELDLKNNCVNALSKDQLGQWLKDKPLPKPRTMVTEMFWKLGMDAMANLFQVLGTTTAKSLLLSRQVLDLRNHLSLRIQALHKRISEGLNLIAGIRQIIDTIKIHAADANKSKAFTITVDDVRLDKIPTSNNTTTCLHCNSTCHENCAYSDRADKQRCCAMDGAGNCGVCKGKCNWAMHNNLPFIMKSVKFTKTVTLAGLKAKFDESTKGMTVSERTVISQTRQIMELQGQVTDDIGEVRACIETLGDIALKPCVMEEDEYYELMIESEEAQRNPNYQIRVKAIKELQQQAKQVRILTKSTKGQESGQLFQTALSQLEQDLKELKAIQGDAPEDASKCLARVTNEIESTRATFCNATQKKRERNKSSQQNLAQRAMGAMKDAYNNTFS